MATREQRLAEIAARQQRQTTQTAVPSTSSAEQREAELINVPLAKKEAELARLRQELASARNNAEVKGYRDRISAVEEAITKLRNLQKKQEAGGFNPSTDIRNRAQLIGVLDPSLTGFEAMKAATATKEFSQSEEARAVRGEVAQERALRAASGLTQEEIDTLSIEARRKLEEKYAEGSLRRAGETFTPKETGFAQATIGGKTYVGTKEFIKSKKEAYSLAARRELASGLKEKGFINASQFFPEEPQSDFKPEVVSQPSEEKKPAYTPPEGEYGGNVTFLPEQKEQTFFFTGQPTYQAVLTETAPPERLKVFGVELPISIEGGQKVAQGQYELTKAKILFSSENPQERVSAIKPFLKGAALEVTGGVRKGVQNIVENPIESAAIVGAYSLSTLAGPLGPVALFAGQNVVETAIGREPTIFAIAREPFVAVGEAVPYAIAGTAAEGGISAVKTGYVKARGYAETQEFKGQIVTRDTVRELSKEVNVIGTEVSREIAARPLLYEVEGALSKEAIGARTTIGARRQILGPVELVTPEQLAQVPDAYIFRTKVGQVVEERGVPRQGAPEIATASEKAEMITEVSGVVAPENIPKENILRLDIRESDVPGNMLRETYSIARTEFEGVEFSTERSLTTKKGKGSSSKQPTGSTTTGLYGRQVYGPQIDYYKEVFAVEGPEGSLVVKQSQATGQLRSEGKPYIIEKVILKDLSKQKGTPTKGGANVGGVSEIEVPSQGGTVLKQKIIFDVEEPKPVVTEQKVEAIVEKKQQAPEVKQKTKKTLRELQSPKIQQTYTEQTVKQEKAVKEITKKLSKIRIIPFVSNATASASSSFAGVTTAPTQATTPAQGVAQSVGQIQAQGVSTTQATTTAQDTLTETIQELKTQKVTRPREFKGLESSIELAPPPGERRKEDKNRNGLFSVDVRRGGQFRTFSTQGLRLEEAASFAQNVVDTSAAASFKITEYGTGQAIAGGTRTKFERLLRPGRYTESKVNKDIFVEKSKFRIDTPGEKKEIRPKNIFSGGGKQGGGLFGKSNKKSIFG